MIKPRVIPTLLLKNGGFYKGIKYRNHKYIGDPINTIRIFNEKEVDELVILDITTSITSSDPDYNTLEMIAGEAFMPMAYGGGLSNIKQAEKIFTLGFEKIVLNTSAILKPELITAIAESHGVQSVVVSLDVKREWFGNYRTYIKSGTVRIDQDPVDIAKKVVDAGAGELIVSSIDKDGTMSGYDIPMIRLLSETVSIPIIASGGAGSIADFKAAREAGAAAVAAGAMFVYQGPHRAVLISYPRYKDLEELV